MYPNYGRECMFLCQCSKAMCNVSVGCVQGSYIFILFSVGNWKDVSRKKEKMFKIYGKNNYLTATLEKVFNVLNCHVLR